MQPGLENNLKNQVDIPHSLFNVILATMQSREELERSWRAISKDIDLADAQEQLRMHKEEKNF
jgi:hypothetical protein